MPILEYSCRACGCQFEFLKLPASDATPLCPECQGDNLERLLSGFAVTTPGGSQARLEAARKQIRHSKDSIDKKVADAEYRKEHRH